MLRFKLGGPAASAAGAVVRSATAVRLASSSSSSSSTGTASAAAGSRARAQAADGALAKNLSAAIAKRDAALVSQLFQRELTTERVSEISRSQVPGRLVDFVLRQAKSPDMKVTVKDVFNKFLEADRAVGWMCAEAIVADVVAGNPEGGMETWVRFLERLNDVRDMNLDRNQKAGQAALIAYIMNAKKHGQDISGDVAKNLLPDVRIPLSEELKKAPWFNHFSAEDRKAILNGADKIRLELTDINSVQYARELPTEQPLELTTRYEEAKKIAARDGGASIGEPLYARFISSFAENNRVETAFEIWNDMIAAGVSPSIDSWNALLKAASFKRSSDVKQVVQGVWDSIAEAGLTHNSESYAIVMDFYFRSGQFERGLEVYDQLKTAPGLTVTLKAFNIVLNALLRAGKLDDAERLLDAGKADGLQPDVVTFNTFIRSFIRSKQFDKAVAYLDRMAQVDVKPDVVTYTNVIDTILKLSKELGFDPQPRVDELIKDMDRQGVKLNAVTFTALMHGIARTERGVEVTRQLFQHMLKRRIRPNRQTIATLVDAELQYGDYERAKAYFGMMPDHGMFQSTSVYNQLIHWTAYNGRLDEAFSLFKKLYKDKRTRPNKFTYHFMLTGTLKEKRADIARDIVDYMAKEPETTEFGNRILSVARRLNVLGVEVPESLLERLARKSN